MNFCICLSGHAAPLHLLRALGRPSRVKHAIFPPPCLFDTDDIILERVSDGGGELFPTLTFIHLLKNGSLSHRVRQEEAVKPNGPAGLQYFIINR